MQGSEVTSIRHFFLCALGTMYWTRCHQLLLYESHCPKTLGFRRLDEDQVSVLFRNIKNKLPSLHCFIMVPDMVSRHFITPANLYTAVTPLVFVVIMYSAI